MTDPDLDRGDPLPGPGHGPAAGSCPEDNVLAALADGTLPDEERAFVERHVARCEDCRSIMSTVAAEVGARTEQTARPVRGAAAWWTPTRIAVAATVLLAIGVALAFGLLGPGTPPTTRELLQSAARDLARERPDLFGTFTPLSPVELLTIGRDRLRGGDIISMLDPAGTVLELRPRLRWEAALPRPSKVIWKVTVSRADGTVILHAETSDAVLEWPKELADLEPSGVYQWTVSGIGPFGAVKGHQVFETAGSAERRAFEEAVREINTKAPPAVRRVLEMQFALRKGYFGRADRVAAAIVVKIPGDEVVLETIGAVARAIHGGG